jgi:hypothetical protein
VARDALQCGYCTPGQICSAVGTLAGVPDGASWPDGERAIPLTELHRLPGDAPDRDTVLEHGELITAVDLPALPLA